MRARTRSSTWLMLAVAAIGIQLVFPEVAVAKKPPALCHGVAATIVGTADEDEITGTDGAWHRMRSQC